MATRDCIDQPPSVNLKCIVFTLLLAAGYWYLPPRNKWVLLALLYFPYLALAWYDYLYACRRNQLGPTYLAHFYAWAKPPESSQIRTYRRWCPRWRQRVLLVDFFVLVGIVALAKPFLHWAPAPAR